MITLTLVALAAIDATIHGFGPRALRIVKDELEKRGLWLLEPR